MVATSAFSSLAAALVESNHKITKIQLGLSKPSKSTNPKGGLNFKVNVQTPTCMNINSLGVCDVSAWVSNQLSNLRLIFGTMFMGTQNKRIRDNIIEELGISGRFLDINGLVFCQKFSIRSYEVGADGAISLETIISHLQETGLNHLKVRRLVRDGLGSTPEMHKRKLIWVSTKMQIVVDRYPTWGDIIQVENWFIFGKNSLQRESVIRDKKNGDILVRATWTYNTHWIWICVTNYINSHCIRVSIFGSSSHPLQEDNFVIMNKETRRLCRFSDEVREEMSPVCKDAPPSLEDDCKLINADCTTYEYTCPGIKPRWSDLDINQHVNNAKYVGLILESAPASILKTHKLSRMTLQYKRECQMDNVLESLTTVSSTNVAHLSFPHHVEFHHLLKQEGGAEIVKARTEWIQYNPLHVYK